MVTRWVLCLLLWLSPLYYSDGADVEYEALSSRPVKRELNWFEKDGWLQNDCFGDVGYLVHLRKSSEQELEESIALKVEIVNHCQKCQKDIQKNSRLWVQDERGDEHSHFLKASFRIPERIPCFDRRVVFVTLRAKRPFQSVSEVPTHLNIRLQNPGGYVIPEGDAEVDIQFYMYRFLFKDGAEHNILLIGFPGVGKTTFIMSAISALSVVPQQLQNVGGATLEGHTTQMLTQYRFSDWAGDESLRINLWDIWGLRPQNFSLDLLTNVCEGRIPHGYHMQTYERSEKRFRHLGLTFGRTIGTILFFMKADQARHPEGLPVLVQYLNHAKTLGYGAVLVVTWLHSAAKPDHVLADLRRRLQIPVLPFTDGCHPNCTMQAPLEVKSVASEKDPKVDKHALVILEAALRLSVAVNRVSETDSWSKHGRKVVKRIIRFSSEAFDWMQMVAWGNEVALVLTLASLIVIVVGSKSGWTAMRTFSIDVSVAPAYRRREVSASPLLRQFLVVLSILYHPLQQSMPAASWVETTDTACADTKGTVVISKAPSAPRKVGKAQCRDMCQQDRECAVYAFNPVGAFSNRCDLFAHCDMQYSSGETLFHKPVQSSLANLSTVVYIAQVVINFLRLIWQPCTGSCLALTAILCIFSLQSCSDSDLNSFYNLLLMAHLANWLVLFAMHQQLQDRLQAVMSEENEKEERLKDLELKLFVAARRYGESKRYRQLWSAQLNIVAGLVALGLSLGLIVYCATNLSGGEGPFVFNLANLVTRLLFGIEFNKSLQAVFTLLLSFVFSSPLILGVKQIQIGVAGCLYDQPAEMECAATRIASKIFRIEQMLTCVKAKLLAKTEVTRGELEDMASGLGLPRSSPDSSALVCAAATYFTHGPEDTIATAALETMASMRAFNLLEAHVDATSITAEMLFAHDKFWANLKEAEVKSFGRLASACHTLMSFLKILLTGGLWLVCCERRRQTHGLPPKGSRAAELIDETFHRPSVLSPSQAAGETLSASAKGCSAFPSQHSIGSIASPTVANGAQVRTDGADEEVTQIPGWQPSMTLELQEEIRLGEENEELLCSHRTKLFRFKSSEWKERGLGAAKLLKNGSTGEVRFLMRQENTGKVICNHLVVNAPPYCVLKPNGNSKQCWVWRAQDCSDGDIRDETLALKFGSPEGAESFKQAFERARHMQHVGATEAAAVAVDVATAKSSSREEPLSEPLCGMDKDSDVRRRRS